MSTKGSVDDDSLWSTVGGGMAGNQNPDAELPVVQTTPSYYRQNDQIPFSKSHLRWSKELHEKFLDPINELGGASKGTPKKIWNLLRVEGVTLYHIKSHLQKYRQGKISRRFLTRDVVPADDQRNIKDELPQNKSMDMEGYQGSSDAFDMNGSEAQKYGDLNHLIETSEMTKNRPLTSVNLEKGIAGKESPHLLPLFPSILASGHGDPHYFPEWSESLNRDDIKSIVPHLNSLGYSFELVFTRCLQLV